MKKLCEFIYIGISCNKITCVLYYTSLFLICLWFPQRNCCRTFEFFPQPSNPIRRALKYWFAVWFTVPTMLGGKFVFVEQQRLHMNFGKIIGNCNPIWLATSMEKHNLSTKFDERASKERKSEFFLRFSRPRFCRISYCEKLKLLWKKCNLYMYGIIFRIYKDTAAGHRKLSSRTAAF